MIGIDKHVAVLSKLLDLTSQKSKIITNNIANASTPGYKKMEVNFQEELNAALKSKDIEKIKNITAKISFSDTKSVRQNGNNVDIDKELIEFYDNADRHKLYLTLMAKKFKVTLAAIRGR